MKCFLNRGIQSEIRHLAASEFPMHIGATVAQNAPFGGPTVAQSNSERQMEVANSTANENIGQRARRMFQDFFSGGLGTRG